MAIFTTATLYGEDYTYETNNGTITITGYTGGGGEVVFPSEINGLPVTSIGYHAFYMCFKQTSVKIPDSVSSIGDGAFSRCYGLTGITIGNSVSSIGYDAF